MRKRAIIFFLVLPFVSIIFFTGEYNSEAAQKKWRLRSLPTINANGSGTPFGGIKALFLDKANREIYAVDEGNGRVVVTDFDGVFAHEFSLVSANAPRLVYDIAVADDGMIYLTDNIRVVVVGYDGRHIRDMDFSGVPGGVGPIQSIAVEGDMIYIGSAAQAKRKIVVIDRIKDVFIKEIDVSSSANAYIALGKDSIYVLDPSNAIVYRFDREGKILGAFGRISSVEGGFSMPRMITTDRANEWVIVLDINRLALIVFDKVGDFVAEFGGPTLFGFFVDIVADDGRFFLSDSTGNIRVFQLWREEPLEEEEETAPTQSTPPPSAPPEADGAGEPVEPFLSEEGIMSESGAQTSAPAPPASDKDEGEPASQDKTSLPEGGESGPPAAPVQMPAPEKSPSVSPGGDF